MSVRYDPLIARALAVEILDRWRGVLVTSIHLDRGRRAARLSFVDGSCLLAALHPTAGFLMALDPEGAASVELAGTERRFRRLPLVDVVAPLDERALILVAGYPGGEPREALALELHTNRWNALDVTRAGDEGSRFWRIETALLTRESGGRMLRRGARYEAPVSTRRGIETPPAAEAWAASLAAVPAEERRGTLLRSWAWTSTLNADWVLDAGSGFDPDRSRERYLELRTPADGHGTKREPAWLLDRPWGVQPYPHPLEGGSPSAGGLLAAFTACAESGGGVEATMASAEPSEPEDGGESAQLARRLAKRHKRADKRLRALERQLAEAGPSDEPRALGQLLLARKSEVRRGADRVELVDFDGTTREVELDPRLDAVGNAERYFDEARRRDRAAERLPVEIGQAEARRDRLAAALESLAKGGPAEELWELAGGRPGPARRGLARDAPERLPYTRLTSSGGLEIRVGRGARDNDDLTFRHSAPDDIWLHASQSSGAHVILRWGKKDENPPQRDLTEAAMAAAVHSGARHSGTVAVVWTRRKHVRKPRRSPPGTVVPERVKTVFVEPDAEHVRSLRSD